MPKPKSSIISTVGLTVRFCTDIAGPAPHASLVAGGGAAANTAVRTLGVATREIGHTCDASQLGHDGIRACHRWPRLSIHRDRNDLDLRHHVPASRPAVGSGGHFLFVE